jgi:hypothetical protein
LRSNRATVTGPSQSACSKGSTVESSRPTRILVVANRTAAPPQLLDEIRQRSKAARCEFSLLIADVRDRQTADRTLETTLPLLEREAGGPVKALLGGSVEDAVRDGHFDEIILSPLPLKGSEGSRRDFISRIEGLGLPTTIVPDGGRPLRLWVDYDLKSAEEEAARVAEGASPAYEAEGLRAGDIERTVVFVGDVAKSEQDRETNLNTRGATIATVAGLIVAVSSAVAKSVFGIEDWSDWTKIAAVALFLKALFAVAASMVIAVFFVLRPRRGARTKNFLGETLADLWIGNQADKFVTANRHRLDLLFIDRSMRTLPEWHFRNREKARWLRRSWMFLTIGMVLIAIAAVFVLARILEVTDASTRGPAEDLTWGWLGVMLAGAVVLSWLAIRFDWLRAGRDTQAKYEVPREIKRLATKLQDSPLIDERTVQKVRAKAAP